MRRTLLLASAALAITAPAMAQTLGGPGWTGLYAGINLGVGGDLFRYRFSGTTDIAGTNPIGGKLSQTSSGGMVGGQIGYDYQMPNGVVFGLVADLDGSNVEGVTRYGAVDSAGNAYSGRLKSQIDALGTARARLGKAMFDGRFLPYVTGGFAYGGVSTVANSNCSACAAGAGVTDYASSYARRDGWTAGLGADYALTHHLSLRTEYLYTDLGRETVSAGGGAYYGPTGTLYNASANLNTTANVLRVGLNYKF